MKKIFILPFFAISLFVIGCATKPTDKEALAYYNEINDPFEPMNRKIFAFNQAFDKFLLKPVAEGYRATVPSVGRTGVRNFLGNIKEPVNFLNCVFQGNFKCSVHSVMRFFFNTVFGIFGLNDTASEIGLTKYENSFGITLAKYGVPKGPMFVVPILGQMYVRDMVGATGDYFSYPMTIYDLDKNPHGGYWDVQLYARPVVEGIVTRESLLDVTNTIEKDSLDLYASYREMIYRTRQKHINEILGVSDEKKQQSYDFDIDEDF